MKFLCSSFFDTFSFGDILDDELPVKIFYLKKETKSKNRKTEQSILEIMQLSPVERLFEYAPFCYKKLQNTHQLLKNLIDESMVQFKVAEQKDKSLYTLDSDCKSGVYS